MEIMLIFFADMAKLCIMLDNFDPQRNTQIQVSDDKYACGDKMLTYVCVLQKEDDYPSLINLMFHSKCTNVTSDVHK